MRRLTDEERIAREIHRLRRRAVWVDNEIMNLRRALREASESERLKHDDALANAIRDELRGCADVLAEAEEKMDPVAFGRLCDLAAWLPGGTR